LVVRLADVVSSSLIEREHQAAAFMPLGRRSVKVLAVAMAVIATLKTLGFDVTSLLAGLGIGGLAVALASQKTVEHLFGGVTLVADQPVRVGDLCKFGDKTGVVEDIGLRSTRIRTPDRTVVSVPNGEFSAMQIENFSRRDRMRLQTTLALRYETSADQLRFLLTEIHGLVAAAPKVDPVSVNVRFVQFGAYSLDVEITAYFRTTSVDEFARLREDIFLRIMDLVSGAGSGFALPSQTIYAGADAGLDDSKRQQVSERQRQRSTDGDP
jgi:MscS family membrane protein